MARISIFILLAFTITSCMGSQSTPTTTANPQAIMTLVQQTVQYSLTQMMALTPSATITPTATETPLPTTPTPTITLVSEFSFTCNHDDKSING